LKAQGRFAFTCADKEMSHPERLTVLGEEFGEVCHEVNEGIGEGRKVAREKLKKELVQVGAVCVAWLEALEAEETAERKRKKV
jgi:NTP pyrophosphatase (non-canonical NTP hydrolase)